MASEVQRHEQGHWWRVLPYASDYVVMHVRVHSHSGCSACVGHDSSRGRCPLCEQGLAQTIRLCCMRPTRAQLLSPFVRLAADAGGVGVAQRVSFVRCTHNRQHSTVKHYLGFELQLAQQSLAYMSCTTAGTSADLSAVPPATCGHQHHRCLRALRLVRLLSLCLTCKQETVEQVAAESPGAALCPAGRVYVCVCVCVCV